MPVILSASVSTVCLAPGGTDPDLYQDQAAVILGWEIPADGIPHLLLAPLLLVPPLRHCDKI
jgi:hypothetical protein